eukprot:2251222-Prymnesium_polylepis.1
MPSAIASMPAEGLASARPHRVVRVVRAVRIHTRAIAYPTRFQAGSDAFLLATPTTSTAPPPHPRLVA